MAVQGVRKRGEDENAAGNKPHQCDRGIPYGRRNPATELSADRPNEKENQKQSDQEDSEDRDFRGQVDFHKHSMSIRSYKPCFV